MLSIYKMGIQGLFQFLRKKHLLQPQALSLNGCTVAIDISIFMYRWGYRGTFYIPNFILLCGHLATNNITPIWVFDGRKPSNKITRATTIKIEKKFWKQIEHICDLLGHARIRAKGEADALGVALVKSGRADYFATEDSDALVYGCNPIINFMKTNMSEWRLADILATLQLTHAQFTHFAILIGTDYSPRRMGPVTALQHVKNNPPDAETRKIQELFMPATDFDKAVHERPSAKKDLIKYLNDCKYDVERLAESIDAIYGFIQH